MTCLSVSKTVIYFENLCTSEIARVVQDDCNRVVQWMESSKLIINQIKTKSMLLGSWQNLAKSPDFCMKLYSLRSRRLNVLTVRKKERGVQGRHARGEKAPAREPKENVPPPVSNYLAAAACSVKNFDRKRLASHKQSVPISSI